MNKSTIKECKEMESNIKELVNEFIMIELDGNDDKENIKQCFPFMIFYISEHINIDINDINMQKTVFRMYVYLCMKYNVIPVIRMYCNMINMDYDVYNNWLNGINVSSEFVETAKYMHNTCQLYVENTLTNSDKTNINLMFISKAVYGYTETSPIQRIEKIDIQVNDLSAISNRYNNIKSIESNDE